MKLLIIFDETKNFKIKMKEIILLALLGVLIFVMIRKYPSGADCPVEKRCTLQPKESNLAGKTDILCGNVKDVMKGCLNIKDNYLIDNNSCSIGLPDVKFQDKKIIFNSDKRCKIAINEMTKDLPLCGNLQLPSQSGCSIVKDASNYYDKSEMSNKININDTNNLITFPGTPPIEIQKGNYLPQELASLITNIVKEKVKLITDFEVVLDGRFVLKATNLIIDVSNEKCRNLMTVLGMTEQDVENNRITIKGSKILSSKPIFSSNFYCMKNPYATLFNGEVQWVSDDMCYLPNSTNPDSKWKACEIDVKQGNCPQNYYEIDNTSCCKL